MNLALLLVMGASWGLHFALVKMLSGAGIPALLLLFPTLLGISVFFAVAIVAKGGLFRPRWPHLRFFVIGGVLGYVAPILVELLVAPNIDAGLLTLIVTTTPLFTIGITAVLGRESVGVRKIVAAGMGAVAAAALLLPDAALPSAGMRAWVVAAFAVPALYAVYNIYVAAAWPSDLDALQVAAGESAASALFAVPFFAWSAVGTGLDALFAEPGPLLALVLATTVEVWAFFELIRRAGAVYVSFASFAALVGGVSWGTLLFAERPTAWMTLSLLLVTASLLVLGRSRPEEGRAAG